MAIISVAREIDCAVSAENIELTNYEAVAFNDWLVESGKLTLEELHSMDGAEHARTIMRFARRFLIEFYSHFS